MSQTDAQALGITTKYIRANKFKTVRMSATFCVDANRETVPAAALLSRLLTRSSEKYPTHALLSKRLNTLYGARIFSSCIRLSGCILIKITADSISSKYALNQENMSELCTDLLLDIIFSPKTEGSAFADEDFEIEKRQLLDGIDARINDKRSYALSKAIENMCKDDPTGIPDGGYREDAEAMTSGKVYDFWKEMLRTAPVFLTFVGDEEPDRFFELMTERLALQKREVNKVIPSPAKLTRDADNTVTEEMEVAQGKLVLGFSASPSSLNDDIVPLRMLCDIFGGSPHSLLFTEVREKQSLCYYCAARLHSVSAFVTVDSGIESDNYDAAKNGILEQLDILKRGEFDHSLIEASRLALKDSVNKAYDSPSSLELWYLSRVFDAQPLDPEQYYARLDTVTKEQLVCAANSLELCTVYLLKGNGQDE